MTFGDAVATLKEGKRVSRAGWNGKGMWLALVISDPYGHPLNYPLDPYIAMKTVQNSVVPWLASQTDVLAEDWDIA